MNFTGAGVKAAKPAAKPAGGDTSGRRVRTGIMPDFGFSGKGMKVGFVSPGSPAVKAGIRKGDIVVKVGGVPTATLKEYSEALKAYKPGDVVILEYLRDNKSHSAPVTLTAR
jgi:S1-C subfamily serine protease